MKHGKGHGKNRCSYVRVYFYRVVREDLKEVRTLTIHVKEISDMWDIFHFGMCCKIHCLFCSIKAFWIKYKYSYLNIRINNPCIFTDNSKGKIAQKPGEATWEFIQYVDDPSADYLGFVACSSWNLTNRSLVFTKAINAIGVWVVTLKLVFLL